MIAVYQQCPFCERVFEIGPMDYRPMKRHIRVVHTDEWGNGERSNRKRSQRRFKK